MLGVSQAATVGFHFQANYCAAPTYSGTVVTATAFGVASNGWQNLLAMPTGYGCGGCGFTNLMEVVDTTTSNNGLNPLPNGSVTVNWGGYAANVSGFGGYDRPGPSYSYGGNTWTPGNEEVYWGFIRDGVNFGPIPGTCGYSSGDNDQPGYNVDVTGLKSLFTNTPYVVQLVAASDSLWTLTNAFIVDATANSTQSVIYPSLPTPQNQGGTLGGGGSFPRGIGGGLSAVSGTLNTDHLKIIGNRAQHGTDFNRASTISGFIVTDKPVVTMSPQPAFACGGDSFTLNPYAIGVPPLSYQWRVNGVAIPGATASTYSVGSVHLSDAANYDVVVTNLYGRTTSAVSVVTVDRLTATRGRNFVVDSNPSNLESDGLALGSAAWVASSGTRSGVMRFGTSPTDQLTVPPNKTLNGTNGTIMFWMRSSGLLNTATNSPAALFHRRLGTAGIAISQKADGTCHVEAGSTPLDGTTAVNLSDNNWHLVAVTYDQTMNGLDSLYIDGVLDSLGALGAWSWPASQPVEIALGDDATKYQQYSGLLDDIRVYNRILTDAEILAVFTTGALVDTSALELRLNFDAAPTTGVTLRWLCPDAILQGSDVVTGPYSDLAPAVSGYNAATKNAQKFYRYHGHTGSLVLSNPYLM
jgi:hypothetical protein